jgi:hypothetical protein
VPEAAATLIQRQRLQYMANASLRFFQAAHCSDSA